MLKRRMRWDGYFCKPTFHLTGAQIWLVCKDQKHIKAQLTLCVFVAFIPNDIFQLCCEPVTVPEHVHNKPAVIG